MYDKHGIVLRIETTANDVSFFKHHRKGGTPPGAADTLGRPGQERERLEKWGHAACAAGKSKLGVIPKR